MIQANCRERFTAADFDFVVRTLARSQTDHVSLVDLLSDAETRDCVLDNPRLVDAILSNAGQLRISSHFYFYVLARHVLRDVGITDRKLCDYVASLLETFSRANGLHAPHLTAETGRQYVSDMLIALTRATAEQAFLLRAHVGNYSLFLSGIFHENTQRRSRGARPTWHFTSKSAEPIISSSRPTPTARRCELSDVYEGLAERFHEVRLALNRLSDSSSQPGR